MIRVLFSVDQPRHNGKRKNDTVSQRQPPAGLFKYGFANGEADDNFVYRLAEFERAGPVTGVIAQAGEQDCQPGGKEKSRQAKRGQQFDKKWFGPALLPENNEGVKGVGGQQKGGKVVGVEGGGGNKGVGSRE